jgi:hypothetical protein
MQVVFHGWGAIILDLRFVVTPDGYEEAQKAHHRFDSSVSLFGRTELINGIDSVWIVTPKALANFSPAVRAQREPWGRNKQSHEP